MQYMVQKSHLLIGMLLSLAATAIIALAIGSSPASASPFCGGQQVNNIQKCWGAQREMSGDNAYGVSTGVCVGADLVEGTCAPTNQLAVVNIATGQHNPWVRGTSSNLTVTYGNTF